MSKLVQQATDELRSAIINSMEKAIEAGELPEAQLPLLLEKRQAIFSELKKSYSAVLLDLEVRE